MKLREKKVSIFGVKAPSAASLLSTGKSTKNNGKNPSSKKENSCLISGEGKSRLA